MVGRLGHGVGIRARSLGLKAETGPRAPHARLIGIINIYSYIYIFDVRYLFIDAPSGAWGRVATREARMGDS